MLNPVVCSKLHALFGSSVHGAGFEQHEAFVRRWMPVAPSDVLDKIATGSMPAPKGVDEAAWISFLEQGFTPALRQAELDGEVHSMRRLVSVCFEAAMETLSAKDQSQVRDAFAKLHASAIDEITVLTAEAALCRAMVRRPAACSSPLQTAHTKLFGHVFVLVRYTGEDQRYLSPDNIEAKYYACAGHVDGRASGLPSGCQAVWCARSAVL